jgi:hypothetical protein
MVEVEADILDEEGLRGREGGREGREGGREEEEGEEVRMKRCAVDE